jgi:hypothetical protein
MYLNSVLSYLGGWKILTELHPQEYLELKEIITGLVLDDSFQDPRSLTSQRHRSFGDNVQPIYSTRLISRWLDSQFKLKGWHPDDLNHRLLLGRKSNLSDRYTELDALKQGVGVDVFFSKYAFSESCIFVKFPIFHQARRIDLGVLIIPTDGMRQLFQPGINGFEMLRDRIKAFAFLPIKYPLAILGIANDAVEDTTVDELTSSLDHYLIKRTGLMLAEMKLQTERANYDFKVDVPENQTLAKEICAFANLIAGGLLLVGVNNDGDAVGIPRGNLDVLQGRILQVSRNNILPNPEINFEIFDLPGDNDRCILVVDIAEFPNKPCMFQERVYVRSGPEARAAKPHEIRRIILGSEK